MIKKKIFIILWLIIINNSIAQANVQISDFYGNYDLIINGSRGILQLSPCTTEENYNLKGVYVNIETMKKYPISAYTGHINSEIPKHKIILFINFPKNKQMLEGYLMLNTKDAIAGYTTVDDTEVGFYAIKKVGVEAHPVKEGPPVREPIIGKSIRDKISELRYILKDIRTTILIYNGQHHNKAKLGFIWDEEAKRQIAYTSGEEVSAQLLQRTDRNGLTKEKGANVDKLDFGPYFHNFPTNPITLGNSLYIIASPMSIEKIISSPKDYDWIYNIQTGEFRAGGEEVLPPGIPERREDNSLLGF